MSNTDMIAIELPRVKEGKSWKDFVKVYMPPAVVSKPTPSVGMTAEEARRDAIINKLLVGNRLMIGQRVRPADDEAFKREGTARILSIARSYAAYKSPNSKEDDWPDTDNPLIVHARYENVEGKVVHATINYFIPYVEEFDGNKTGKSC